MTPGRTYLIYKKTEKMFCNSLLKKEKILCKDCNLTINSEDCFLKHKFKCKRMWKCLKCQQVIMCDWKEKDKEKELHKSDCGIRVVSRCPKCKKRHEKSGDCHLIPKKYKNFHNFPKIMILTGAISQTNNCLCYKCHFNGIEKCEIHSTVQDTPEYANYLCITRESKMHGVFEVNYLTENSGFEDVSETISKPYQPCIGVQTSDLGLEKKYNKCPKKMNIDFVEKIQPERKNTMDILFKKMLLDPNFENTIVLTQNELMGEVLKSFAKFEQLLLDFQRGSQNFIRTLLLPWRNIQFTSVDCFLEESNIEEFSNMPREKYFPMGLNLPQFYKQSERPELVFYYQLDDNLKNLDKKDAFFKAHRNKKFEFDKEMKEYLYEKSMMILNSILKLQNVTIDLQRQLKGHYPVHQQLEFGSLLRCPSLMSFVYFVMVFYCTVDLKTPIYALKNSEHGVYDSRCSSKEYEYQMLLSWQRPHHVLFGSHIHKDGSKKFNFQYPDLYDENEKSCLYLHGCFYHGHMDSQCPKYPKDVSTALTKTGITFLDSNNQFNEKVSRLMANFPEQIQKIEVLWECQLATELKKSQNAVFYKDIYPNLKFFKRLKPR